ncbi:MAG: metallophosphoesterase [Desulfosalsimonadaceae bacterium]
MTGLHIAAIFFGALIFYLFVWERFCIRVRRYRIPVPHLPGAFAGFRIVQLSDLHYGPLQPMISLRYAVWRANSLKCDIIVCTGDYVLERNGHKQIDRIWPLLDRLHAPLGVYSILGNHDHWADTGRSLQWMDKTGQNLRGQRAVFERQGQRLWLAGGGDLWEDPIPVDRILAGIPDADCRIVLAHNPDSADTGFSGRVDLMISGHTHGGQFVLPFYGAPFNPVKNKAYTSGRKRSWKGVPLFITTGIGWGTFPVRFNCYPEIAVLELWPDPQQ